MNRWFELSDIRMGFNATWGVLFALSIAYLGGMALVYAFGWGP